MIYRSSVMGLALGPLVAAACGSDAGPGAAQVAGDAALPPSGDAAADAASGPDGTAPPPVLDGFPLHDAWTIQASSKVTASPADIATRGFATTGWVPVTVPTTVLAGLVAAKVLPDPYVGDALQALPALAGSSWWYRTEFLLPADFAGHAAWLDFEGINYRANVWLNGKQIASSTDVVGTFTSYEWDVTSAAHPGEMNALAVEILPPDLDHDLALTWLDWNPAPPDRDMGIWRDVLVKKSGAVAVRGTRATSALDASLATAHVTIKSDLTNTTNRAIHATIEATLDGTASPQEIDLAPNEKKTVTFTRDIAQPRLWWPAQMGAQEQYDVHVRASVDGATSDEEAARFGIRDVKFDLTQDGHRLFRINGKRLLVRGGGWASDMMLRQSPERLDAELRYVRDLGLNTIRLEGKLETDDFYSRADALGILTMPGWMCCDRWQQWDTWTADDHRIATASMHAQARRLRNHPSVVDFLIGSDEAPSTQAETELLQALHDEEWPNAISPSASDKTSAVLGASGVKMTGPYDYVAPAYWYLDTQHGGAWGFNTESGPGPAIPEIESVKAMLSPSELSDLWSKPTAQHFHAGTAGKQFDNLSLFNAALAARHGAPTSLEDYVRKAQLMGYEGERAPYEAYGRNKYASATGFVHWMLNNAWPSLIWHLYPYDLTTAGAYYGAKKGNEALHIQYSYDDGSIVVVNNGYAAAPGLSASVRVLNLDGTVQFSWDGAVDAAEDAAAKITTLPSISGLSPTYFVDLRLKRGDALVSANLYWLSTTQETIDLSKSDWYHTPTTKFADYTGLAQLAPVKLKVTSDSSANGDDGTTRVTLENPSGVVAFFVRMNLTRGAGGAAVVPAFWEDNYVSLLPGEKRTFAVTYRVGDLQGAAPVVDVRGWNASP